ncbi:YdcF family protein [Aliiroseovarius subalbicans]|uniref:YdcF family protein n=1 Tax=Aliiroseovarius subalbicans TaxID=2925840 RepID=UPI001F591F08|nr:YdcF family protein [Aliiroseovarius subalbicans]
MTDPVILVLGAAVWPCGVPSPTLKRRASHAAQLYLQGDFAGVIACGGLGKHSPSEAKVIGGICEDLGVPPAEIQLEDQSTTTLENIRLALPLLPKDTDKVLIVTDAFHAPRARLTARRFGLRATTSSPSLKGATSVRTLKAFLREGPAYLYYLFKAQR